MGLIVCFAFGMAIMLPPHEKDNYPKTFWALLPKMFVMVTGEQEFMNIPFASDGYRVWETAYFLVFLMLTVVILLNMLNGLAVADAKTMLDASETDSFCSLLSTAAFWGRHASMYGYGVCGMGRGMGAWLQTQAGLHVLIKTSYSFAIYKEENKNVCQADEDPNFTICDELIKSAICVFRTKEKERKEETKEKQEKEDKKRIFDMLQEERKERSRMFDMLQEQKDMLQEERKERSRMFDMLQKIGK